MFVFFARLEDGVGEVGLVGGVGEGLCFQAQTGAWLIGVPVSTGDGGAEVVSGVDLKSGLVSVDLDAAVTIRISGNSG